MGWTFPDNHIPINARITFGGGGVWYDVNLGTNNDVPSGTKLIVLKVRNTHASINYWASVRPNGNTIFTHLNPVYPNRLHYLIVKLDANRIFEGVFGNAALDVVVVGYSDSDTMFQDFVDKSLSTTGSYQTEDVSADGVPVSASAVIVGVIETSNTTMYRFGLRPIGAIYDYYKYWSSDLGGYPNYCTTHWPVGLDANRQFEHKIENVAVDTYLWGYLNDRVVMLASPVDKTPGTAGSWQDVDVSADVPADAIGAIFQVVGAGSTNLGVNFRKKGSSDNITSSIEMRYYNHLAHWVGLDADRIAQCYMSAAGYTVYLIGYVLKDPIPIQVSDSGAGAEGSLSEKNLRLAESGVGQDLALRDKEVVLGDAGAGMDGLLAGKGLRLPETARGFDLLNVWPPRDIAGSMAARAAVRSLVAGVVVSRTLAAAAVERNLEARVACAALAAAPACRSLTATLEVERITATLEA